MSELRVGSVFSGIGAWEKALTNLGIDYDLKWYIENDKFASKSFAAVHEVDESLNLGDVFDINPSEIGDIDLLVYSPPCQSFSTAGNRKGDKDPRGRLFYEVLPIIKEKQPKYAVMENVVGLTQNRYKELFEDMMSSLDSLGYNSYYEVLNASNYGIPQNRERVFIMSIRKESDDGSFQFPKKLDNTLSLDDLIKVRFDEKVDKDIMPSCQEPFKREYADIINSEKDIYQCDADSGWQDKKVGITVSPALRANKQHTSVLIDDQIKRVTRRDMWRLMGFTDEDYDKAKDSGVSESQLGKQAGNSIVVNVVEEIFKELLL